MKNVSTGGIVVILDGTQATNNLVADFARAGTAVTAVGSNFRDVVSVMSGDVYALVADVRDPEQWQTALVRAEQRHGTVDRVIDPAGALAAAAA